MKISKISIVYRNKNILQLIKLSVWGTGNEGWQDVIDSTSLGKTGYGHSEKNKNI